MEKILNQELITALVTMLLIPILPTIAGFIGAWFKAKTAALKKMTANDEVDKYIDILDMTIYDVVTAFQQEMVESIKAMSADGKLTEDEIIMIKKSAKERILSILGNTGIKVLEQSVGDLTKWIESKIEREVHIQKLTKGE